MRSPVFSFSLSAISCEMRIWLWLALSSNLGDAAFDHVLMDKGRIEIRSYTFEHDAQEIAVRLQDSLFHGKFLQ